MSNVIRQPQLKREGKIFPDLMTSKWGYYCPSCGKSKWLASANKAAFFYRRNTDCYSCAKSGDKSPFKGKVNHRKGCTNNKEHRNKISLANTGKIKPESYKNFMSKFMKDRFSRIEERLNMSIKMKNRYSNIEERNKTSEQVKAAMHRPEVRKKHLAGLHHSKWLKVRTDKGQLEILNKWNRLGFKFEPNYQVCADDLLCYIDGYDKEKNVVFEYDGKYHNRIGQKEKDLIRQDKIIELLKPKKFWRYDSVNKQVRNVMEERKD